MRPLAWVAFTAMMLTAPACTRTQPVAPLRHISGSRPIRVGFLPKRDVLIDFNNHMRTRAEIERSFASGDDAISEFKQALGDTLRRAGYEVTESGPHDVRVVPELRFVIEARQSRHGSVGRSELVRVVLHLYGQSGAELDRFERRAIDEANALGSSESVAVDLVNAMVQSPKVGGYLESLDR